LNDNLFEIIYIYILIELINQGGKLEKLFIIIYLVYMIEEDKEEMKKKLKKRYI